MLKTIYKGYYKDLTIALLLSVVKSVLTLFILSKTGDAVLDTESEFSFVFLIGGLFFIVLFFFVNIYIGQNVRKLNIDIVSTVRRKIIKEILKIDHEQRQKQGANQLYVTLTKDLDSIANLAGILPLFGYNAFLIIATFSYLLYLSPPLFISLFILVSLAIFGYFMFAKRGHREVAALVELRNKLFSHYDILMNATKELSVNENRKYNYYHVETEPTLDKLDSTEKKSSLYWVLSESWITSTFLITVVALVSLGRGVFNEDSATLVQFTVIILFIVGPLNMIVSGAALISQAIVSFRNINSLEFTLDDNHEKFNKNEKFLAFNNLKLNAVTYSYANKEEPFTLGPLNFSFSKGEVIFITGGNGSGKSTFIKLILGLTQPSSGQIGIDDLVLDQESLSEYRNYFSCIFQDFYLFESILDQKGDKADDSRVNKLIKQLDLAHKVQANQGVLSDTKLSQGQRRRLALVLALFENSPIFVFDEWAADQDVTFKNFFYKKLIPQLKKKGKLILAVTHDSQYYSCCDTIIKLIDGKVARVQHRCEQVTEKKHLSEQSKPSAAVET